MQVCLCYPALQDSSNLDGFSSSLNTGPRHSYWHDMVKEGFRLFLLRPVNLNAQVFEKAVYFRWKRQIEPDARHCCIDGVLLFSLSKVISPQISNVLIKTLNVRLLSLILLFGAPLMVAAPQSLMKDGVQ